MIPEVALEHLKQLGYVLVETTKDGGQLWTLQGHGQSIHVPGPTGVQIIPDSYIERARANALKASIAGVPVLAEDPTLPPAEQHDWRTMGHYDAAEWVASSRPPTEFPYGLFISDPSMGAFYWFLCELEAVEFLRMHGLVPWVNPGEAAEQGIERGRQLLAGRSPLDAAMIAQVNGVFAKLTRQKIEWAGTLKDLEGSHDDFCRRWREQFRKEWGVIDEQFPDGEYPARRLGLDEVDGFIKYVTAGHY